MPTSLWPNQHSFISNSKIDSLAQQLKTTIAEFTQREHIDTDFLPHLKQTYIPLAAWIAAQHTNKPVIIGVNGAQGSGKSTLSKLLGLLLKEGFDKSTVDLSIDDLYLSRQERLSLAKRVHPLLEVRGVPGTHDVERGINILTSLVDKKTEPPVTIPVFDKAQDDLLPRSQWRNIDEPVDVILFEGWCVGAQAQSLETLAEPINDLERSEDPKGIWRGFVNDQLQGPYKRLFALLDQLVMLKVPDMDSVFEWRNLQEEKLRKNAVTDNASASRIMSPEQVARFIMFYERITRHCLDEMPQRADVVLELNKEHQVNNIRLNR